MIDFKNNYTFLQEGANRQEAANIGITDRVPIIAQMPEFARKELELGPREFDSVGRFSHVLEIYHQYEKLTGSVLPPFRCSAPFTLAANIRGTSNLLIEIFMKPDFVRELLDRITEKVLVPWLLRVKKEFPNLKKIGADDALGSLPIVSPDIMQDWIIPPVLKLREHGVY